MRSYTAPLQQDIPSLSRLMGYCVHMLMDHSEMWHVAMVLRSDPHVEEGQE
jgi:hypothetical protein